MLITVEDVRAAAERLHLGAEENLRRDGYTVMVLILLRQNEPLDLVLLSSGIPGPRAVGDLARFAAARAAQGAVLTGEVWIAKPGPSAAVIGALPDQDVPRPGELPGRREALLTTGYHAVSRRTVRMMSMIERTPHGAVTRRGPYPEHARDLSAEAFLAAVLRAPTGR